jgi:hypothetical protein
MNIPIQISAKNLGALAMPDFCPRCFWIGMKAEKFALPNLSRYFQFTGFLSKESDSSIY